MSVKFKFIADTDQLLVRKLQGMGSRQKEALRKRLTDLESRTVAIARRNVHSRTGKLASSIQGNIFSSANTVGFRVYTHGVRYARIQEKGGRTPPHEILPVNVKALAFQMMLSTKISAINQARGVTDQVSDSAVLAAVHHPGGEIKAQNYIADALSSVKQQFIDAVKASVKEGWR